MPKASIAAICFLLYSFQTLFAKPPKPERPIEATVIFDLLKRGRELSLSDAENLEAGLTSRPSDPQSRIELLSYYSRLTQTPNWDAVKAGRLGHILWFIEH